MKCPQTLADKQPVAPVEEPASASNAERLRPWLLAATVAVFVVPPLLPTESSGRSGEMLPIVMLTVILAAVWAAAQIGRSRFRIRFQATDVAVLALVGFHTIAAVLATRHGHARPAINMLWVWIGMGLAYFLLRQLLATAREARAVAVVMIGLAVVLSGYGLWQYAHEFPALRAAYAKNPDAMLRSQGMWFPPGSPERTQFDNRLASREPLATFALTNSLAGYLAPWLVVTVGIALLAGRSRRYWSRGRLCIAASLAGLLIAACLVLTKSRSGYAATVLGLLLVAFCLGGYRARAPWKLLLIGAMVAAALLGLALAVGGLDVEVLGEASKSFGYRVQYWRSTARMIAGHPLFGCGPGQFQNVYTGYKLPEASEEIAEPHNFLLELWATAGTPAALAMLAVLACFVWSFVKRKEQCEDDGIASSQADAAAWVFGGGIVGLLAAWPLGLLAAIPPAAAVYFIGAPLGIAAAFFLYDWVNGPPEKGASGTRRPFYVLAAIAVVVLLVNLLAAGGIGFAGVAGSFWLLLALGLFCESGDESRPSGLLVAPTLAVLLAILGVICYFTAYRPVLNAQSRVQAALNDPAHAEGHLQAAALADPLSAQPWRQLAALSFEAWKKGNNRGDLERFKRYTATALELDAGSSSTWLMSGDRYLDVYAHTHKDIDLDHALAGFRKAVELYPNDATTRAKYALALRTADKQEESEKQAETAIRLDDLTPHADGKIPKSVRQRLIETPG